ncbi:MAG: lysophospholipid acyltransferase family protein [Gammaproteobacteria bacterium]|nr:lysophospholipid acyltransferase family protein [Gammaproteobacteria bacterium]
MRLLRFITRFTGLLIVFLYGIPLVSTLVLIRAVSTKSHERAVVWAGRHWFRLLARVLSLRISSEGQPAPGPVLIAANHVSWLDIVVMGQWIGPHFISKSEVANWPIMGWFARNAGTLFIERGQHDSAARAIDAMTWRLKRGDELLFFPEGTTSGGEGIRRFKPRLFQPAVRVNASVQPVSITYRLESIQAGADWDAVQFIDGYSFMQSIIGVCWKSSTAIHVTWHPAFPVEHTELRDIATRAEQAVATGIESTQARLGFGPAGEPASERQSSH